MSTTNTTFTAETLASMNRGQLRAAYREVAGIAPGADIRDSAPALRSAILSIRPVAGWSDWAAKQGAIPAPAAAPEPVKAPKAKKAAKADAVSPVVAVDAKPAAKPAKLTNADKAVAAFTGLLATGRMEFTFKELTAAGFPYVAISYTTYWSGTRYNGGKAAAALKVVAKLVPGDRKLVLTPAE